MSVLIIQNKNLVTTDNPDIITKLYYQEISLPTKADLIKFNVKKSKNFIKNNKLALTKLANKSKIMPLFDIINTNIYLINIDDVYDTVVCKHYRFPDYMKLKSKYNKLNNQIRKNQQIADRELKKRILRKLNLMIKFLDNFNLVELYKIYLEKFYYSNPEGKNITQCLRKSFMPYYKHLKPFYTREEVIKMAYNFNIITKINEEQIDNETFIKLCKQVKENDLSAEILIKHQQHIIQNNCYGLVQYFTFHGSFFMNQYLRNHVNHNYQNKLLEKNINLMTKLIKTSPKFNKNYVLFRFIHDDTHLAKLKIGEIFTAKGFISTTRDPFYNPETYKFGFILIKIKIPKDIVGIALSVETVSLFAHEQEILLAPRGRFRLDAKNTNVTYYTLDKYQSKINTQYEFTFLDYMGDNKQNIDRISIKNQQIDFLTITKINSNTIAEKINYFCNNYVNDLNQFDILINNKNFTICAEWYASTTVYKDLYAAQTSNGFSMYLLIDGNIIFLIELGESDVPYMYINYYRKFSSIQTNYDIIMDKNLIDLYAYIAYYFDINKIIIYTDYISCEYETTQQKYLRGGNYCYDFYQYLKYNKKRFLSPTKQIHEITPAFSYFNLDQLKTICPNEIMNNSSKNDLIYQLYKSTYKKNDNLANMYIWLVENYCYLTADFVAKLSQIYPTENPFNQDYYLFNALEYLYNQKKILYYPASEVKTYSINKNRSRMSQFTRLK